MERTTSTEKLSSRGQVPPEDRRRRTAVGSPQWTGELLGEWQAREVRGAYALPECRGLPRERIEDLYQDTVEALLGRRFESEEHLRNALRLGLRHRALNVHRDERRRRQILERSAPGLHAVAEGHASDAAPESAALQQQDRLIVTEFLTELDPQEQRVFWHEAEGLRYRAIAPMLGIEVNAARKVSRAVERKRERFQLLYDTGRLCGFRAASIQALQRGEATSEQLAARAFAHLESCARCRAEHKTSAQLLRARFQGQAIALLPLPALAEHGGWASRAGLRVRVLTARFLPELPSLGGGGSVREQAIGLIAGGGAIAKVAAGAASVAVIAGGALGGAHVLTGSGHVRHEHRARRAELAGKGHVSVRPVPMAAPPLLAAARPSRVGRGAQGSGGRAAHAAREAGTSARRRGESGFAYLGVPAQTASVGASAPEPAAHTSRKHSGGEFSP